MTQSLSAYEDGFARYEAVEPKISELTALLLRQPYFFVTLPSTDNDLAIFISKPRFSNPRELALDLAFAANSGDTKKDVDGIIRFVAEHWCDPEHYYVNHFRGDVKDDLLALAAVVDSVVVKYSAAKIDSILAKGFMRACP